MIKIELNEITDKIQFEGKQYLLVEKNQLSNLLNQNAEHKKDVENLKDCIFDVLRLMGVFDEKTKTIKQSLKDGDESYLSPILSSLGGVITLLSTPKWMRGKDYDEKVNKKFGFIKKILPLIEKHGNKQ